MAEGLGVVRRSSDRSHCKRRMTPTRGGDAQLKRHHILGASSASLLLDLSLAEELSLQVDKLSCQISASCLAKTHVLPLAAGHS